MVIISCLIFLNAFLPTLPVTVVLLVVLLRQSASDLSIQRFYTTIPLFAGVLASYASAVPSASELSFTGEIEAILPTAFMVTVLVYASSVSSFKLGQLVFRKNGTHTPKLLVFPLLWSAAWSGFCSVHPLGRLLSWTPVAHLEGCQSILSTCGLVGLDFIAASLAVY